MIWVYVDEDNNSTVVKDDVIKHAETLCWCKYNKERTFKTEEEAVRFLSETNKVRYYKLDDLLALVSLKQALKDWLDKEIENTSEDLLEKNPEEYNVHYDEDYVDVGVGGRGVCVRSDMIYDEDSVYDDAKESIIQSVADGDLHLESLFENKKFIDEVVKILEKL